MNLGETCEDPAPWERGSAKRGDSEEGGEEAQARGGRASGVRSCTVEAFKILGSRGGRGG
jgi:hypothetical protein